MRIPVKPSSSSNASRSPIPIDAEQFGSIVGKRAVGYRDRREGIVVRSDGRCPGKYEDEPKPRPCGRRYVRIFLPMVHKDMLELEPKLASAAREKGTWD